MFIKARKPKRKNRNRKSRVPRSLAPRSHMKPYTFNFKLRPQILLNDAATIGSVSFVLGSGGGNAPLTNAAANLSINTSSAGLIGFSDVALGCPIQLEDIASYAAYTSVFDAYKINYVTARIEYLNNSALVNGTGLLPTVHMYWDQDDAAPPPSLQSISGKQGAKLFCPGSNKRSGVLKFRPLTRNGVNTASTVSGAIVPNKAQWINCTAGNVPHYGFKAYITDFFSPGPAAPATNAFRIHWTYNVSFRAPIAAS